jgi:AmpD protein
VKITNHIITSAKWCPTVNFNERPSVDVNMLVVHNISLPPDQFGGAYIEDFFCNQLDCSIHPYFKTIEGLKVSAHLLIRRDGQIVQFVPFNKRAWHAGRSEFKGEVECNDFSIGIEMEGSDHIAYENDQYDTLAKVTLLLMHTYPNISMERLVGHNDIAPGRKTDPGASFNWLKYKALIEE